jgi:hypothetical protein
MISIEVGEELKSLTANKPKYPCPRFRRPDLGMAICMSVCAGFTIVMLVLLILNVKEFSQT